MTCNTRQYMTCKTRQDKARRARTRRNNTGEGGGKKGMGEGWTWSLLRRKKDVYTSMVTGTPKRMQHESWKKELDEREPTKKRSRNRPQMNATYFGKDPQNQPEMSEKNRKSTKKTKRTHNHSWKGLKEALGALGGQDPKEARGIGFGGRMGTILEPSWTPLVTVWQL